MKKKSVKANSGKIVFFKYHKKKYPVFYTHYRISYTMGCATRGFMREMSSDLFWTAWLVHAQSSLWSGGLGLTWFLPTLSTSPWFLKAGVCPVYYKAKNYPGFKTRFYLWSLQPLHEAL